MIAAVTQRVQRLDGTAVAHAANRADMQRTSAEAEGPGLSLMDGDGASFGCQHPPVPRRTPTDRQSVRVRRLRARVGIITVAATRCSWHGPRLIGGAAENRYALRMADRTSERHFPALAGVRVLVTGGTSGLGAAMVTALTGAGARVALTGRDEDRAVAAAARHGAALGLGMDVRDEDSVERGVERVIDRLGGLDVLVNNAGIGMRTVNPRFLTDPQPFWQVGPDAFRDVVATNFTGYHLVAREVVPRLLEAGGGRVVNVTANHQTMARRGFAPYGPSRAGAEALSRVMAADLAGSTVTVNLLLPGGATDTGMVPDDVPEQARRRLLSAEIMAAPIRWLCSPEAAGVHDQRIVATRFETWLAERAERCGRSE